MYVKINREMSIWRAIDHEREMLESHLTKRQNKRDNIGQANLY
ncbi:MULTISPECIES: hypothetical protein [unclassified Sphingobium]